MTPDKPIDDKSTLDDNAILDWLRANPKFLSRNPEATELLIPPTRVKNDRKVADFQGYLVKRLKDDREDVISKAREIVETSRANMNNQARIHNAVLLLLEATGFQDFIHIMTMDFTSLLNVDIVSLAVEIDDGAMPQIDIPGVRAVGPGTVDLLTGQQVIILESATRGLEDLYGGGAGLVKSQALVRLSIGGDTPPALLAFGSRDAQMFQPGMGTEQLAFLGRVIERCFRTWLS